MDDPNRNLRLIVIAFTFVCVLVALVAYGWATWFATGGGTVPLSK
jgi:hypothetical protein